MITNKKIIFLLIFLILILIFILVMKSIVNNQQGSSEHVPAERNSELPTGQSGNNNIPGGEFKVISNDLTTENIGFTQPITLTFNKALDINTLAIETEPKHQVKIIPNQSFTQITIDPIDAWIFNTNYTIKILKQTQSVDKQTLNEDYIITFKTYSYSGI